MLTSLLGVLVGGCLPIQTSINSRLRKVLGSPFFASFISFCVGTLFLLAMNLLKQNHWLSNAELRVQPWWIWLGGFLGVFILTTNLLLLPRIGSVQTVVLPTLGQVMMAVCIDQFGWFNAPQNKLDFVRILAILMLFIAVLLIILTPSAFKRHSSSKNKKHSIKWVALWFWKMLGVGIGALMAIQSAINGHLGTVLNSPTLAALVSFAIGTSLLALLLLFLALPPFKSSFTSPKNGKFVWWMGLGGILGALFVLGNATLLPKIGTGSVVTLTLLGQFIGSALIDQFGWLGTTKKQLSFRQLFGLLLFIFSVYLLNFF